MTSTITEFEIKILRELNGEEQEDLIAGAAMWEAASYLKRLGFVTGNYIITDKGRDFLRKLDE